MVATLCYLWDDWGWWHPCVTCRMIGDGGIFVLPGGMVEDDNGVLVTSDIIAGEDETEAKHKLQHGLH
jgi:hypothetical protein